MTRLPSSWALGDVSTVPRPAGLRNGAGPVARPRACALLGRAALGRRAACLLGGVGDPAEEQDSPGRTIADGEDERAIDCQLHLLGGHGRESHHDGGRGGGLGALFVHVYVGLVDDVTYVEAGLFGHAGEVGQVGVECRLHAERAQSLGQAGLGAELELGHGQGHF